MKSTSIIISRKEFDALSKFDSNYKEVIPDFQKYTQTFIMYGYLDFLVNDGKKYAKLSEKGMDVINNNKEHKMLNS